MTPDNESISASARPVTAGRGSRRPARKRVSAVIAALAVVGFSAAMIAPTGMSTAGSAAADTTVTPFSLAAADTQNITVSVEGAEVAPMTRGTFEVYVKPKPKPKPKPPPAPASSEASSGGGGQAGPPRYTGGGSKEDWMSAAGIASSDWPYVDYIVSRESGWNPNATNPSSGACGLVQALPCSKVPGNGYNPVDNLRWGNGYAVGRYGSWSAAYAFWTRNHWW